MQKAKATSMGKPHDLQHTVDSANKNVSLSKCKFKLFIETIRAVTLSVTHKAFACAFLEITKELMTLFELSITFSDEFCATNLII